MAKAHPAGGKPGDSPMDVTEKAARKRMVDDVNNRFAFHPATPVTGPQHDAVRQDVRRLATKWAKTLPVGRHQAMALTSLQEAMWAANAAIACDTREDDGSLAAPPASKEPTAKKTASKRRSTR